MQFTTNGMHHTPATTMVFQSDDYGKFNLIKGNRGIDANKVKKIMGDIEEGTNLLARFPILVVEKNKKLDIIDGQHRFFVSKKIKQPVYYILADPLNLYQIARLNSNTEKWKPVDFINCYIELGNENYTKLEATLKKYPGLSITLGVALLASGKISDNSSFETFKRGTFLITEEKQTMMLLKKASLFDFSHRLSRSFIHAIQKIVEADHYSIDELIAKVNANAQELRQQPNTKKYLSNLQEIANKGKHKQVLLY